MKENRRINTRHLYLMLLVVVIPYNSLYLLGMTYLFLPMAFFILYFLMSVYRYKAILDTKGTKVFIVPWLLIWLFILIAHFYNRVPHFQYMSRSTLQRIIIYLVFFLAVFNEMRKSDSISERLQRVVVLSIFLMGIFYFTGIGVDYEEGRLTLFGTNANGIGMWCSIGALFAIDLLIRKKQPRTTFWYLIISIIFGFMIMILTGSRKSIISFSVGILIYYLFLNRSFIFKLKLLAPLLIFGAMGFSYLMSNSLLVDRFSSEMEQRDYGGRLPMWEESLLLIHDNLIVGAGPALASQKMVVSFGMIRVAHNEFITIASWAGLPGLFALIYFLWVLGKRSVKVLKKTHTYFSPLPLALTVVLILFLFSAGGGLTSFYTWFLFAFIAARTEITPQEPEHQTAQS